jgi:putative nucleotidyltransferase with HDIG domain
MTRIDTLRQKVKDLYESKNPGRAELGDWMYENHVLIVAKFSKEVAERVGAKPELAEAAGMLHDIADAVMVRENPEHETKSLELARSFLQETNFTNEEMAIIVDDVIKYHSCHGSDAPLSLEGRSMATGDALGHLTTPFYDYLIEVFLKRGETASEIKEWGKEKIERDFNKKIFFDEIRAETRSGYERVRKLFEDLR